MLRKSGKGFVLEGPAGKLAVPMDDEVTEKLFMLYEGVCTSLGPTAAARKHGYTKQRFYQLLKRYEEGGAVALCNRKRGPKGNYRRTDEAVRQIIRLPVLGP